jgi:hypothetical protein
MNNRTPVHVTVGSGKMENMQSVNVSSLQNTFCQKLSQINGTVCTSCYSNRYAKLRPTLEKRLVENYELLSTRLLEDHELPVFNAMYVRYNSYGELINDTHYQNLIAIARANPHVTFGLWTKHYKIVMRQPKEPNIKYIYSVPNVDGNLPSQEIQDFFDKIFIVQRTKNGQNCHGKCIDCRLCYPNNDVQIIREKIK